MKNVKTVKCVVICICICKMAEFKVRLYTVYSDTHVLPDNASDADMLAAKEVQGKRDQIVLGKMQRMQVPSFPMPPDEFVQHMSTFKALTVDFPTLCLLFELPGNCPDKVLVVKDAACRTFGCLEDAAHWCASMPCGGVTKLELNKVPAV